MKRAFLLLTLIITSCLSVLAQKTNPAPAKKPLLRNSISLTSTGGVVVDSAYLEFEDGTRVPRNNKVKLGQVIFLVLQIKSGWVPVEDNIQIGAKEIISTVSGQVVLSSDDLFKDLTTVSVEDAKYITLKATITSQEKKLGQYYTSFEVWDKQGSGKIKGRYGFTVLKD